MGECIDSPYKNDAVADLIENENEVQNDDRGDSILKEKFKKANKASGVDQIAAELLHAPTELGRSRTDHFVLNCLRYGLTKRVTYQTITRLTKLLLHQKKEK